MCKIFCDTSTVSSVGALCLVASSRPSEDTPE